MIKAQKGTKDIFTADSFKWQVFENIAQRLFTEANYKEIRTPIFEATELFARGVGDSTDIVNKEMYTFTQKDRSITLRPENTAGVVRAYIEHGMNRLSPPVKLWYKGPMFRYERPQAGRQRQFHQLGVEMFGVKEPSADAEVIALAINYLEEVGIKNLELEINSLGCEDCRSKFKDNFKKAMEKNLDKLCPDCQVRYEKNPLRILDCKSCDCQEIIQSEEIQEIIGTDFICGECKEHFDSLQNYLNKLNINYKVNKLLVRGLDYYNRTVFEIKNNSLGAQNAVCGGGRYDNLVKTLGGEPTPAVGWAMGLERLISLAPDFEENNLNAYIVSNYTDEALKLAIELRQNSFSCDFDFSSKKFTKQLEKASKLNAKFAVILGEEELEKESLTIKNLASSEQITLPKDEAIWYLKKNI